MFQFLFCHRPHFNLESVWKPGINQRVWRADNLEAPLNADPLQRHCLGEEFDFKLRRRRRWSENAVHSRFQLLTPQPANCLSDFQLEMFQLFVFSFRLTFRSAQIRKYSANWRRQRFLFIPCLVSDPIFLPPCHTEKPIKKLHYSTFRFLRFNLCHLIWNLRLKASLTFIIQQAKLITQ